MFHSARGWDVNCPLKACESSAKLCNERKDAGSRILNPQNLSWTKKTKKYESNELNLKHYNSSFQNFAVKW